MVILSIIIVTYNTKNLTLQCIESIITSYKEELKKGLFELILVDNNSSDNTVATINKNYLKIIENKENVGFTRGNNIGARKAKGTMLLT